MLINAMNSGPLASDTDEDSASDDPSSDVDAESADDDDSNTDIDAGTNADPESTAVVQSLGTAVASAIATTTIDFGAMQKEGLSSVLAEGTETSTVGFVTVESNANTPTSAAVQSNSIIGGLSASAPTAGINGSFTGGASRVGRGRELNLEGGITEGWLVWGVFFLVWVVL